MSDDACNACWVQYRCCSVQEMTNEKPFAAAIRRAECNAKQYVLIIFDFLRSPRTASQVSKESTKHFTTTLQNTYKSLKDLTTNAHKICNYELQSASLGGLGVLP